MHSGSLGQGDYMVVLLNAAASAMEINATSADIFIDDGGSISTEAKSEWDVYDLWANRMPDAVANQILQANSTMMAANVTNYYYNATKMSYADGLKANNTLLMGKKIGTLKAKGTLSGMVSSHGVRAYRLRPAGSPVTHKRDEL